MKKPFHTLILGLGKSGYSAATFLAEQGHHIAVADTRAEPPFLSDLQTHYPDVPFYAGEFTAELIAQAKQLLLSPGVDPHQTLLNSCGATIIGDIELFAQHVNKPVVAITGSNGKSTVTTLMGEVLRDAGMNVAIGGNLGTPALDLLKQNADIYVLELSSYQLETTYSLQPKVACCLNITPDHLDRHGSFENYINAKHRIFQGAAWQVTNADDENIQASGAKVLSFQQHINNMQATFTFDADYIYQANQIILNTKDLRILGLHNAANVCAVLCMAEALALPLASTLATITAFPGLPHRCEWAGEVNGVRWINDSKGTNIGAAVAAIQSFAAQQPQKLIWLAGGQAKGQDFSEISDILSQFVSDAIVYGEDADKIAAVVQLPVQLHRVENLEQAIQKAQALATPGQTVLFSPACASFDAFPNFEVRGDAFKKNII
ncbi:MAG: UDP-N-acetylmuramoylalanine--D-glutamate ligase [marine bacterium B5-7]|nr:MAG: UDP-N-acetylmuramoylalanine--D-glutamate ligase [marine bacterium B5-7]